MYTETQQKCNRTADGKLLIVMSFFLFQGIENCEKSLLQPGKMDQLNLELTISIILLIMISSKELP